ncbi:MAG: sel1 repeat family protein [Alphaproteobacteria bacterium]|nr:sel1 repeat family protein [Alphaproteobacteria bacterium]
MKHLLRIVLVSFVASFALATPSAAGPFEDGVAAVNRGDFATALRLFRPLADQGFSAAQSDLGVMYENGQGVPQDDAEAVKWFRKGVKYIIP